MDEVIRLRGHHILCLLGFRGLGYNEEFVANMTRVHSRVFSHECEIELVIDADDICKACPKLESGCNSIKKKDSKVLELLSFQPQQRTTAAEIYSRVSATISAADLEHICPKCKWRSLGYCAEGLLNLRTQINLNHESTK